MGGLAVIIAERWKAHRAMRKFNVALKKIQQESTGQEELSAVDKIKEALSTIYPPLRGSDEPLNRYERIFKRGTVENDFYRLVRNIILLEIFGLVMYAVIALQYVSAPHRTGTIISSIIHVLAGTLLIFPCLMKVVILYVYRTICTRTSAILILIILVMAFEVPAMNATRNVAQVADSVNCVARLITTIATEMKAAAKEKVDEVPETGVAKLFRQVVHFMKRFKDNLRRLADAVTKITETIKAHYENISNLSTECRKFFVGPYRKCVNFFYESYSECSYRFPAGPCSAVQKLNILCDTAKGFADTVCNFPTTVRNGLTEGLIPFVRNGTEPAVEAIRESLLYDIYAKTKDGYRNAGSFALVINDSMSEDEVIFLAKDQLKSRLKAELKTYGDFIRSIVQIIRYFFVPITVAYPFAKTALYVYKFLYREEYKNTTITQDLIRVDAEQAITGHPRIFPLTAVEKTIYTKTWKWRMNTQEKARYYFRLAVSCMSMSLPILFILVDIMVYEILYIGYQMVQQIQLDVPDHYELKATGNGFIAKLFNSILEVFAPITEHLKEIDSKWRSCFVEPNPPDYDLFIVMFWLFVLSMILARVQIWLSRGTSVLATAFFPHRARPRALYLYSKIIEKRRTVLSNALQGKEPLGYATHEAVARFSMHSRGLLRVECFKCTKPDMRIADTSNVRVCANCTTFYCIDCYCFTRCCLRCANDMQISGKVELYWEEEHDDPPCAPAQVKSNTKD